MGLLGTLQMARVSNRCFGKMHTCCSSISQLFCCNCHRPSFCDNYEELCPIWQLKCLAQFEGNLVVIIGAVFLLSLAEEPLPIANALVERYSTGREVSPRSTEHIPRMHTQAWEV